MRNGIMSEDNGPIDANSANGIIRLQQSQTVRKTIQTMSHLLNTGLSNDTLDICIRLCEAGVHPQVLAEVIQQIRREVAALDGEN